MKSKPIVYIFRITVILAAILGAIYTVKFFILGSNIATLPTEDAFKDLGTWSMIFFIYLIVCCIATVLSVITFNATGKVCSVMRTVVLAFAAVADLLAYKYVSVFGSIKKAVEAVDEFQDIEDNGFIMVVLSFLGAVLMVILGITSIVAIIKKANE